MLLKNTIVAVICGGALVSLPAFGQENPVSKADLSIQAFVPLVENTNAQGVQQSSSTNYGLLAGYRFFFDKHSGVELTYGFSRNSQNYNLGGGSLGVQNNSDEVLAAYVFRFPAKHWSPFVLGGAGALVFDPSIVAGGNTQARLGYVYGGGADFNLKGRFFLRTEYRGVFYNSETFKMDGLNMPERFINREQPTVVFGYSF